MSEPMSHADIVVLNKVARNLVTKWANSRMLIGLNQQNGECMVQDIIDHVAEFVTTYGEKEVDKGGRMSERVQRYDWDPDEMMFDEQGQFVLASDYDALLLEKQQLEEHVLHLRTDLTNVKRERDLALAHDRQPYPTTWAYEQACTTIAKRDAKIAELEQERDELKYRLQTWNDAAVDECERKQP